MREYNWHSAANPDAEITLVFPHYPDTFIDIMAFLLKGILQKIKHYRAQKITCQQEKERKIELGRKANLLDTHEEERLKRIHFKKIDHLIAISPQEFEDAVAQMFNKLGYGITQTPYSGDFGKDIIIRRNGKTYFVECKRYGKNKKVGRPELQKLYGAISEEKVDGGFLVTTAHATKTASEYAKKNNIELIDGELLIEFMKQAYPKSDTREYRRVMCRECGDIINFPISGQEGRMFCNNGHEVIDWSILESLRRK